jgi:proline iminopeptidase
MTLNIFTMKATKIHRFAILTLLLVFILGCQPKKVLTPGEGYVEVTGGKVWYRIVGQGDQTPLLLLHGGPGFPSYYLNPLAALSKDRPVIFLDQLGCGRSDNLEDTSLMTVDAFVEQLEQFRASLGLEEFYLYGHSWGTMLGMDYYVKYPQHIQALILASPALSTSKWTEDAEVLIATLPESVQMAINTNVETGTYDAPEYQQAINEYYQRFVARKLPWDPNMDSTFTQANEEIYNHMWGPSEFTATGNLKYYDRTADLSKIEVATLYICGEYDEARPPTVQYYQSLTPGSKFVMIENAAHVTMHDNPQRDIEVISSFLNEIDLTSGK